ncbi:hypothetical protein F2Q69_00004818 [Brassica cretica]|uniref:WAT1-related protein n=1 Tax=Brassica cretica TaxID=69181 RepID=A0A8S9P0Q6_BRACR|nr:hypothetical protein F2Q69_00004818 [Brassica cretica]
MDMETKKPYMMVTMIQLIYAIMFLISKSVLDGGMNTFVFVFYRQAFATMFLAPLAFFFERCIIVYFSNKSAPPLSFVTFIKIFILSLFGMTLSLDLNGIALSYTSATLAAATTASLPAITFFFALFLGMETLTVKSIQGTAKLLGITVCMGGVITLALYKGPLLKLPLCLHLHHHQNIPGHVSGGSTSWLKGCVLMVTSNILWGLWLVLQGRVLKVYPSKLYFTTLHCLLSSIQSFVIAIAVERDISAWKLGWNLRLVAVIYCGFIVTGVAYYLQSWVIEKRGPVFLSMFTPLSLFFTILSSAVLLCEIISLGRFYNFFRNASWNVTTRRAGLAWIIATPTSTQTHDGSLCTENVKSPLMAEALALRSGLLAVASLDITSIRVYSDCQTLIRAIQNKLQIKEIFGIVSDIMQISSAFESISFSFVPRSENQKADCLAKRALISSVSALV